MKKFTLSALALVAAAVAAPAFAQSSVTLYGRLNTTVETQKENGGARKWVVANNASRLGFKGLEDIGGGLKASFNLEHGFNSDTGVSTAGTTFWGREAWVQLAGSFGAVRLGSFTPESYFATADYISMHNHDTGSSEDALYAFAPWVKNNKVGYFTPTMGGFNASLSASLGEGAVKRAYDMAANYDDGPMHLGFGYSDQGNTSQWAVRGLYELGAFTLGAYYNQGKNYTAGVAPVSSKYKAARVAVMYSLGASEFHFNLGRASNGEQMTLGYNYNLSKRTKIYGYYTDRDLNRDNTGVTSNPATFNKRGDFSALAFGVRHNF